MSQEPPTNMPPAQTPPRTVKPVADRFQVSRGTLFLDRFMTWAIQAGGIAIIVAVFAIFVFIASVVLPLFRKASVEMKDATVIQVPAELQDATILGVDEWAKLPFLYDGGNEIVFFPIGQESAEPLRLPLGLPEGTEVTAATYNQRNQRLILGTAQGEFTVIDISFTSEGGAAGGIPRQVAAKVEVNTPLTPIGQPNAPIRFVAFGDGGVRKIVSAIQQVGDDWRLHALTLRQKRGLMGAGKVERDKEFDLSGLLTAKPERLLVSGNGDSLLVAEDNGEIVYFFVVDGELQVRQRFKPFGHLADPRIASMDFLFGDVSMVLTGASGHNEIYSLFWPETGGESRVFGKTKEFPQLNQGATYFASSLRNKAFLLGHGNEVSLRFATTETVRWSRELPFSVKQASFDPKYEHLAFLTEDGTLQLMELHDPHPEAGWRAYFGKVWYEGANEPDYVWQSTSGTDDFEPKYSLTPLIVGSLKGTFYALLFAVPIALAAAIYVSNFMEPRYKNIVKPTMEIMASLPSVVLGFLAALWLAPIIVNRIPAVLLMCLALPLVALAFGAIWVRQPVTVRARIRPGLEFLLLMPLMLLAGWGIWNMSPLLDDWFFAGDFRLWWPQATGTTFDQSNSLVVGFMMGFAVIPIIFTIAEDSLSNVPSSLTAASAALGASRWQTVQHVVLPIASAGIFSALMIGLGRAVGETMIVVMATGNTPVMDLNPFSGMRTLSANIAVELPEAPPGSTHYRTLFLGALVLFLMTFMLNTVAELLRQHLREKYKLV